MGIGPSKLRFVAVALMWAAAISLAAAGLMVSFFGDTFSPLRTLATSLVVGTFVALFILARQDHDGFEVERVEEARAEAEGFVPVAVKHESAEAPGAEAVRKAGGTPVPREPASPRAKSEDDKPRSAPTRRIN